GRAGPRTAHVRTARRAHRRTPSDPAGARVAPSGRPDRTGRIAWGQRPGRPWTLALPAVLRCRGARWRRAAARQERSATRLRGRIAAPTAALATAHPALQRASREMRSFAPRAAAKAPEAPFA